MIEAVKKLRAAGDLHNNQGLVDLGNQLELAWSNASKARDVQTFENAMKEMNGLWAKAKNDIIKVTKRPLLPAKPWNQM